MSALDGDVVVYGGSSWDGSRLTEHHLARAVARRARRVLFVDSPRSVATPLRAGGPKDVAAALRRLRSSTLTEDDGVHVLRTLTLPPVRSTVAKRASQPLIARQVGRALVKLGMHPDVVVAARNLPEGVPGGHRPFVVSIVKDWLQAGAHLTGLDADALRRRELATWRRADLVCATSTRLVERLAQDGIEAQLLRHGFDAAAAGSASAAVPAPLAALPRPRLGCVGRIDGRWSFDALDELAARRPEASVVLLGPVSPMAPVEHLERLLRRPNVHHLPPVPSDQVASWLDGFDVTLIPYLDDEWQRYASPLKVYDYLNAGTPIAATGSPAMGEFPERLIEFELDPAALPELVDRAIDRDSPDLRAQRRAYAQASSWDVRVEQLATLIDARRLP